MEKITLVALTFLMLIIFQNLVFADCTDLGRFTSWSAREDHTIIFYSGNSPIAKVDLQDCSVNASSNVRLIKNYVCDSDKIVVDGEECAIMTVSSASTTSF
jgi:hypothetical protein